MTLYLKNTFLEVVEPKETSALRRSSSIPRFFKLPHGFSKVPVEDVSTHASDSLSDGPSFDDSAESAGASQRDIDESPGSGGDSQRDFSDVATETDDYLYEDSNFVEASCLPRLRPTIAPLSRMEMPLPQVQPVLPPYYEAIELSKPGHPEAIEREWPAGIVELICLIRWAVGAELNALKVEKKSKKYFIHVNYGRPTTSMDLVNLRQGLEGGSSNCGPPRVVAEKHAVRLKCFESFPLCQDICYDLRQQGFCSWKKCKWQHEKAAVVTIRLMNPMLGQVYPQVHSCGDVSHSDTYLDTCSNRSHGDGPFWSQ